MIAASPARPGSLVVSCFWLRRFEKLMISMLGALAEFGYDVADVTLDDLIAMKEAAGRPKDHEDLRVLKELRARGGR